MTTEAHIELPPETEVETLTLISFKDGSPMQFVFAGTSSDLIKHGELNEWGATLYLACLRQCFGLNELGVANVRSDHADDLCGQD